MCHRQVRYGQILTSEMRQNGWNLQVHAPQILSENGVSEKILSRRSQPFQHATVSTEVHLLQTKNLDEKSGSKERKTESLEYVSLMNGTRLEQNQNLLVYYVLK